MFRLPCFLALLFAGLTLGCSDDSQGGTAGSGGSPGTGGAAAAGGTAGAGGEEPPTFSADPPLVLDEANRPAMVAIPDDYDPSVSYPLLMILHGRGVTGQVQAGFFRLFPEVDARQFVLIYPDGIDAVWNATPACCDFADDTDDVAYLGGLIEEAQEVYNIDEGRVYLMGHSNGGFMSFRMACERSDLVTAIVTLAGATFDDPADCAPAEEPVSALVAHGTEDPTILYGGGEIAGEPYPGAVENAERMASRAGCSLDDPTLIGTIDLTDDHAGEETERVAYTDCDDGFEVELWTLVQDGGCTSFTCNPHIPVFTEVWAQTTIDWLLRQSK